MSKSGDTCDWQSEFDTIPLREVLDANSHPTFVLDLDPDVTVDQLTDDEGVKIVPIYCNWTTYTIRFKICTQKPKSGQRRWRWGGAKLRERIDVQGDRGCVLRSPASPLETGENS